MPETNPFRDDDSKVIDGADGATRGELLALRAVDFAGLPYAIRLDQLIEALPKMRTQDLIAGMTTCAVKVADFAEQFLGAEPGALFDKNGHPAAGVTKLVACAAFHLGAELDRRVPARER
jgi:hypothetical protein